MLGVKSKAHAYAYVPPTCIWMDAGVLSFKLCDRQFRCEDCPLDRALRGVESVKQVEGSEDVFRDAGTAFDEIHRPDLFPPLRLQREYFYAPRHWWAHVESLGRLRLGLDDFAQQLLGPIFRIQLPEPGTLLRSGAASIHLTTQLGAFSVEPPIDGRVIWVNPQLKSRPSLVNREPYTGGGLMLLESRDLNSVLKSLFHGDDARDWLKGEMDALAGDIEQGATQFRETLGPTMTDGGSTVGYRVRNLRSGRGFKRVLEKYLGLQPVTGR